MDMLIDVQDVVVVVSARAQLKVEPPTSATDGDLPALCPIPWPIDSKPDSLPSPSTSPQSIKSAVE